VPSEHFAWKRFWGPAGTSVGLQDGGYLPDPDSPLWPQTPQSALTDVPVSSRACFEPDAPRNQEGDYLCPY
jgi:hypothetical protein